MKKLTLTLFLALMVTPAMGDTPSRAEQARLYVNQCSLQNIGAGLSMWQRDHQQTFPKTLDELVPNYLRRVPLGPSGSSRDWGYRPSTDGKSFQISLPGQQSVSGPARLGHSFRQGSDLRPASLPKALKYEFQVPARAASDWEREGPHFFGKNRASVMSFRLRGPFAKGQSGIQWVGEAISEQASLEGVEIESRGEFTDGELSGTKIQGKDGDYRFTKLFLTDGEIGWEFSFTGPSNTYTPEQIAIFEEIVASRKSKAD